MCEVILYGTAAFVVIVVVLIVMDVGSVRCTFGFHQFRFKFPIRDAHGSHFNLEQCERCGYLTRANEPNA